MPSTQQFMSSRIISNLEQEQQMLIEFLAPPVEEMHLESQPH